MFSLFRLRSKSNRALAIARRKQRFERLEDRSVLSTFAVTTLSDSGTGSLRQAITDSNAHPGPDVIDFSIAGVITLNRALPTITDSVNIDGTSAPGYSGAPVVEINNHGLAGLVFNSKTTGSTLSGLSIVNASGNGVTLQSSSGTLIVGNYIGVALDGTTVAANRGNGIELDKSNADNIGGSLAQDRNIISGNKQNGIVLNGSAYDDVFNNYIGTDVSGTLDVGNGANGVFLTNKANNNTIGVVTGNVISGNNGNGVFINNSSSQNSVSSNIIGLDAAGTDSLGNGQDGVKVQSAGTNTIGQADPVTGVSYYNADNVPTQPVTAWQGIRGGDISGQYLITGTSDDNGLLFEGSIDGTGTSYLVNYPNAQVTSVYGPDNLGSGEVRLVGSYRNTDADTAAVKVNGFVFEGTTADLSDPSDYQTIDFPGAEFNYVHSTMGGLVVGNYDSAADHGKYGLPLGPGHAYIYNLATQSFLTDIVYPGSISNTAYGIWYNGGTSYTIVGGYSLNPVNNLLDQNPPIGQAYMVDYDSATGNFTNWTSFSFPNGTNFLTHFEGISSVEKGVYTLNADSVQIGTLAPAQGSFVTVRRNADGSFGSASWVNLNYTGSNQVTSITSSNAVYGNQVVGIVNNAGDVFSYQATVNSNFELSNVISGNGANGIELNAASSNTVAMNYIGTDTTGMVDLGNAANGVLITGGSKSNMIGGEATGGNDPTNGVFVQPPQGNVISGNNGDGVLITGKATSNQLSGNFIGTDATGDAALGNSGDGVGIVGANGNSLIGCTFQTDPFVFYNVISGNDGNGLTVNNSNNTTIQANFFGMGADNTTAVGNAMNGVLVEGSSSHTTMGGPIPLGNVDAANAQNGIFLKDKASYFTSYNTFDGVAAFTEATNLGNGGDGMLITSTGGHNLIRTNVVSRNHLNGIELAGQATGVDIVGNIVGLDWNGFTNMGNVRSAIEIDGNAHDDIIGGPQPTFNVIPQNTLSGNGWYGVDVEGTAHNIAINHSYIGTDITGLQAIGNAYGIVIGGTTSNVAIGSTDSSLETVISGNNASGVLIQSGSKNSIVGTKIGVDSTGIGAMGNGAAGIYIVNSSNNMIGGTQSTAGNIIANNNSQGVLIQAGTNNGISHNSIYNNGTDGIELLAGANNNQAAPVLTSIQTLTQTTLISGTLTSKPKTTFTIEFYANSTNGASGRVFLGTEQVKTNSEGLAMFTFVGPTLPLGEDFVTATATDPANNTSEFSSAIS